MAIRAVKEVPKHWCTNSVAFSPNGKYMYHADSFGYQITEYPYDQTTGVVKAGTPFHSPARPLKPDGACVNAKGQLWVALHDGGVLELYDPNMSSKPGVKNAQEKIEVQEKKVTCGAIGGPNMDWMFITGLDFAGLYVCKVETKGLPESRFNDT